jgi:hypothetical protein
VRGGVQVARDRRAAAAGSIAGEGDVDIDVEGELCCDAGCDEIRAETGVVRSARGRTGPFRRRSSSPLVGGRTGRRAVREARARRLSGAA